MVVEPQDVLTCWSSTIAFWAILARFVDYNSGLGPGVISTNDEPRVRLCVGHQHSRFWPILVRFNHYYSLFWGAREISTIDDPRGAFTCSSSTLTVLANSDPFRGLLLTVLGPKAISIVVESQVALTCRLPTLIVLADSGPFHGLITHCFGVGVISMINESWDGFTCQSSALTLLADSGPFRGILLTVLGSWSDFSMISEPRGVFTC